MGLLVVSRFVSWLLLVVTGSWLLCWLPHVCWFVSWLSFCPWGRRGVGTWPENRAHCHSVPLPPTCRLLPCPLPNPFLPKQNKLATWHASILDSCCPNMTWLFRTHHCGVCCQLSITVSVVVDSADAHHVRHAWHSTMAFECICTLYPGFTSPALDLTMAVGSIKHFDHGSWEHQATRPWHWGAVQLCDHGCWEHQAFRPWQLGASSMTSS